ncbi:MAG: lysophospholipid acyltransferase family protein [Opitutaceae bacterium]|nr:lysophospholipid acyltransferase family protein [Opitutaceae bacterium]
MNEVRGWRRAVLWLLAALLRLWGRTLRFEVDEETMRRLTFSDVPVAIILWHNRLFLSPEIFRRYRKRRSVYGLVSASRDGAWLAAFYRLIGIMPVRGSSSRLGREAARELIDCLRAGHDVGITPDGPRGPRYEVKGGALIVARRTGAPMVLLGAEFTRAWRLNNSWDRFYVPYPFSRVRMRCTVIEAHNEQGAGVTVDLVKTALVAINPDR